MSLIESPSEMVLWIALSIAFWLFVLLGNLVLHRLPRFAAVAHQRRSKLLTWNGPAGIAVALALLGFITAIQRNKPPENLVDAAAIGVLVALFGLAGVVAARQDRSYAIARGSLLATAVILFSVLIYALS